MIYLALSEILDETAAQRWVSIRLGQIYKPLLRTSLNQYPNKKITFVVAKEDLNNYYVARNRKDLRIKKPEQIIPGYIKQIIIFLDNHEMPNKVRLSNFLLDMDGYSRGAFNDYIDSVIRKERLSKRVEPFFWSCEPPICCYVIIPNVECRSLDEIKRHAYCVLQREKHNWT